MKNDGVPIHEAPMASRSVEEHECFVHMFLQVWGSTALGFGGIGGQACTNAYTVVVFGPCYDAAVFFGGRLAYHIHQPNRQFHEDVAAHSMSSVGSARKRYETEVA